MSEEGVVKFYRQPVAYGIEYVGNIGALCMMAMIGKDILLYGTVTVDGIQYFEIAQEFFVEIGQTVVQYNTIPIAVVSDLDTKQSPYRTKVSLQCTHCIPGFFATLL